MVNFWKKLRIPFTVLAPMDGVTDIVFRQMLTFLGKPDVLFTEFIPVDGIFSKGNPNVISSLLFKKNEQPIVAQVWGNDPEMFYKAAKYISTLGFLGIDINTGCPDRATVKTGACAALIMNWELTARIIKAVKKGAKGLPVSVKTRIGFSENEVNLWIPFLLKQNLDALTVHLRTANEQSRPPAHWEEMPKIIEMRNKISPKTIIVGNGDIYSISDLSKKHKEYGCDGYMIGRGALANPWIFSERKEITRKEKFDTYLRHIGLFKKTWGDTKPFDMLKKFCKVYINNFAEASSLRERIMETRSFEELENTVTRLSKTLL